MTVEVVLLLTIFATLLLGIFLGPSGPIDTFNKAAPRLGARVERNISVGDGFRESQDGQGVKWSGPSGPQ